MYSKTKQPVIYSLSSFEEFEDRVELIRRKLEDRGSELLFRGQEDSSWELTSTLERRIIGSPGHYSCNAYFAQILAIKPEIEATTGKNWTQILDTDAAFDLDDVIHRLSYYNGFFETPFPYSDYLAYLRHFAFPSPFLDWTLSEYVAAFFAFSKANPAKLEKDISIYVYCEKPKSQKSDSAEIPSIRTIRSGIRSQKRHFSQKSRYTICGSWSEEKSRWSFVPHELILRDDRRPPEQDFIWKFNIPARERNKVLRKLEMYNLNSYSLFGSEEALLESLAFRVFDRFNRKQ